MPVQGAGSQNGSDLEAGEHRRRQAGQGKEQTELSFVPSHANQAPQQS